MLEGITPTTLITGAFIGSALLSGIAFWASRSYGDGDNSPVCVVGVIGVAISMIMGLGWMLLIDAPQWAVVGSIVVTLLLFVIGMRVKRSSKQDDFFHALALASGWLVAPLLNVLGSVGSALKNWHETVKDQSLNLTFGMLFNTAVLIFIILVVVKATKWLKSRRKNKQRQRQAATA